jgi:hypothetical protein
MIGFYNRGGKCLERGTDWFLIYSTLHFVFKRLNGSKVSILHCKQFLGKRFGTQKTCWLDDEHILQGAGDVSALLDLYFTVFVVKNLIRWLICE